MVQIIEKDLYTQFAIYDGKKIASAAKLYDYHDTNFDWVLISDVDTEKPYMRLGYGSQIMNAAYNYVQKRFNGKIGIYLLVKESNTGAIVFYRKLGYKTVKTCKIGKTDYYVMTKGNADINQLKKVDFGG